MYNFSIEIKKNQKWLYFFIKNKPCGYFDTWWYYRKTTYTDRYLHANSHHCTLAKIEFLQTMVTRALQNHDE